MIRAVRPAVLLMVANDNRGPTAGNRWTFTQVERFGAAG
jgi:hypothetical protein